MPETALRQEPEEVQQRLAHFGVTLDEMRNIVLVAANARSDATPNFPLTAPGTFAYHYGTSALREIFLPKGWSLDRSDGIESVYSEQLGVRIVYQNVDLAANPNREPRAVSSKGPASKRLVDASQPFLFPDMQEDLDRIVEAQKNDGEVSVWFLCVSVEETSEGEPKLRAELSFPELIEEQQFSGFRERIFIVWDDNWGSLETGNGNSGDGGSEPEPEVTRKYTQDV